MKELRKCEVEGRKGRFHVWENYSDVIPPALTIGGHGGGVVSQVFAIVEFENGKVERCEPYKVVFVNEEIEAAEKEKPKKEITFTERRTKCPFCEGNNKNAIIYADKENKEYFVYCETCKVETIETFRSEAAALKAFAEGKTKSIAGGGANG